MCGETLQEFMKGKESSFLYLLFLRRKKKCRAVWAYPITAERPVFGASKGLSYQLRNDEEKFFNYFLMRIATFAVSGILPLDSGRTSAEAVLTPSEIHNEHEGFHLA
ncbi:hypothetical protein PR048_002107 [Dryococelus australis]|uniref:Uncharacterized protein n=1 Tax=Dryococelus australis TaxID=614101 RepID=A0ABQ9IJ84_9NEOP|nr:hypothetical protein PR048_002107 [Dryococelus australis]